MNYKKKIFVRCDSKTEVCYCVNPRADAVATLVSYLINGDGSRKDVSLLNKNGCFVLKTTTAPEVSFDNRRVLAVLPSEIERDVYVLGKLRNGVITAEKMYCFRPPVCYSDIKSLSWVE